MADNEIKLNIYDNPPKLEDNTNKSQDYRDRANIYHNIETNPDQTQAEINATNTLPTQSLVMGLRPDISSAPRANYGPQLNDNIRKNDNETPNPYLDQIHSNPIQPYPQYMTGLPNDKMNQIPTGLVPPPALQPYNAQNTQPVIIQENYNNQMPQQIIYSEKSESSSCCSSECCTKCLAVTCSILTVVCCFLCLCLSVAGSGSKRRGRL